MDVPRFVVRRYSHDYAIWDREKQAWVGHSRYNKQTELFEWIGKLNRGEREPDNWFNKDGVPGQ
jgi:hypothetical protein